MFLVPLHIVATINYLRGPSIHYSARGRDLVVGACALTATPMAAVCEVVSDLQAALTLNPNADRLAVLQGLLNSLLGGLLK
jgi:hypothetical protein